MLVNKFSAGNQVIVGPNTDIRNRQERPDEKPWPGKVVYAETTETAKGPIHAYGVEPIRDEKFGARDVLEYRLTQT
jgi:hypothetical protein